MASATFEEHPTDPNRVILRKKPRLDQGADYERGFIDGMQYQMQSSVDKAVNAMSRTWVGLTDEEKIKPYAWLLMDGTIISNYSYEARKLKEDGDIPLFTKVPWVDLTEEDDIDWEEGGNLKDLVKAIGAKLKEKNT